MSFLMGYWLFWAAIVVYVAVTFSSAGERGPALLLGLCLMLLIGPILAPFLLALSVRDFAEAKE